MITYIIVAIIIICVIVLIYTSSQVNQGRTELESRQKIVTFILFLSIIALFVYLAYSRYSLAKKIANDILNLQEGSPEIDKKCYQMLVAKGVDCGPSKSFYGNAIYVYNDLQLEGKVKEARDYCMAVAKSYW